ncbi:hypothetical protein FPRO06_08983 [Fusarium proliferatum]|nr:hypothetical protein FPRO06_08983 [Fusarium proliferatum]
MHILSFNVFLALATSVEALKGNYSGSRHLWYDSPGSDFRSSLPIGNGRLGALVQGSISEKIIINENSVWSGPFQDRINPGSLEALPKAREMLTENDYRGAAGLASDMHGIPPQNRWYSVTGNLLLDFWHQTQEVSNYERWLDTLEGTTGTSYGINGVTYTREVVANFPLGVIAARFTASNDGALNIGVSFGRDRGVSSNSATGGANNIMMDVGGSGADAIPFTAGLRIVSNDGIIKADGSSLKITKASTVDLFLDVETSFQWKSESDWKAGLVNKLDQAVKRGFESLKAEATSDHQSLMERVALDLGSNKGTATIHHDSATGWGIAFMVLGVTLAKISMGAVFSIIMLGSAVTGAGLIGCAISVAVLNWARSGEDSVLPTDPDDIRRERSEIGLDPDRRYVAICGTAGAGKSSVINALRGIRNSDQGAARAGTSETTINRWIYEAEASFDRLLLVDFPGAGTQRVPSSRYYYRHNLYCYDLVLIICGERFGEIELTLVRACIAQNQRFAIIRSRSDEAITRVADDSNVNLVEAKAIYIQGQVQAIAEELQRSGLAAENIAELLGFFILVNKNDLRILTALPPDDWPREYRLGEIHERRLLQFLGKAGVTDLYIEGGDHFTKMFPPWPLQGDCKLTINSSSEAPTWNFTYRDTWGSGLGVPASLQGIWNDMYNPLWGSKFTVNINTEMNYWLAETTDLTETLRPLWGHMYRSRDKGSEVATKMYGCPGYVSHHNLDLWGDSAPHDSATADSIWPSSNLWISQHMMEHYRFTGDKTFLREKAWPLFKDIAAFFDYYLFEFDGKWTSGPSTSPENVFIILKDGSKAGSKESFDISIAMDNSLLREFFSNVIEAAGILGIDLSTDNVLSKSKDYRDGL